MNRFLIPIVLSALLGGAAIRASAQSGPPALPALGTEQAASVRMQLDFYRRDVEERLARHAITPEEAQRLVAWREWQLAQQAAGLAPAPGAAVQQQLDTPQPAPVHDYAYGFAPYVPYAPYSPYGAPGAYYWGPGPYYFGPIVCAGRWGHHWSGRICI